MWTKYFCRSGTGVHFSLVSYRGKQWILDLRLAIIWELLARIRRPLLRTTFNFDDESNWLRWASRCIPRSLWTEPVPDEGSDFQWRWESGICFPGNELSFLFYLFHWRNYAPLAFVFGETERKALFRIDGIYQNGEVGFDPSSDVFQQKLSEVIDAFVNKVCQWNLLLIWWVAVVCLASVFCSFFSWSYFWRMSSNYALNLFCKRMPRKLLAVRFFWECERGDGFFQQHHSEQEAAVEGLRSVISRGCCGTPLCLVSTWGSRIHQCEGNWKREAWCHLLWGSASSINVRRILRVSMGCHPLLLLWMHLNWIPQKWRNRWRVHHSTENLRFCFHNWQSSRLGSYWIIWMTLPVHFLKRWLRYCFFLSFQEANLIFPCIFPFFVPLQVDGFVKRRSVVSDVCMQQTVVHAKCVALSDLHWSAYCSTYFVETWCIDRIGA